ncbi:MAG: glutaredoxin [Gammaproteobacteria bacterium]|nr:glutaredoxin [Gammaproteobacteria bacterium]MCF6259476.1 glutaredoxin [Gammaproteobacteria bacterium]
MKRLLVFLFVGFGLYQAWQEVSTWGGIEPLYAESYVVVYGRDSCGWTQKMIRDLEASNVDYYYRIVDETSTADVLHSRMEQSGISTRRYNLPVVDVNGQLSVRPDVNDILPLYKEAL